MKLSRRRDDEGFTIVELILAIAISGIVLSAISAALIVFWKNATYTSERDDHSAGADLVATYLNRDLASATAASVNATACGQAGNDLVLTWVPYTASTASPSPVPGGDTYAAAYDLENDPDVSDPGRQKLMRRACVNGAGTETTKLVGNLAPNTGPPGNPITDFQINTSYPGCPAGSQGVAIVLKRYGTDTNFADYQYAGCLKARTQ